MISKLMSAGIVIGLAGVTPTLAQPPIDRSSAMQATSNSMVSMAGRGETARTTAADEAAVAALDVAFQRAVKTNDAATIDRILHRDYWLVLGNGTVVTRQELINEARAKTIDYEMQDEVPGTQTVRVWNDTAVVTAKLNIKGHRNGQEFSRTLWFSDTYVRTASGWKYAFAQASLPLPNE